MHKKGGTTCLDKFCVVIPMHVIRFNSISAEVATLVPKTEELVFAYLDVRH